jgi:hypothetical protein
MATDCVSVAPVVEIDGFDGRQLFATGRAADERGCCVSGMESMLRGCSPATTS